MSMSINPINHTINVADLTDQDTVLRVLQDVQDHGSRYSLLQNGVEVAMMVPPAKKKVEEESDKDSEELMKKRLEVLARVEILSKEIAQLWKSDETAVEAIINDRNASDRRLFHGSR